MYDDFDMIQADEFEYRQPSDDVWDDYYNTAVDDIPDCEE